VKSTRSSAQQETGTLNRKPLQQPALLDATWELRFRPDNRFRVLYTVDRNRHEVHVLGVGVKDGNRLLIEGKEMEL